MSTKKSKIYHLIVPIMNILIPSQNFNSDFCIRWDEYFIKYFLKQTYDYDWEI